MAIVRNTTLQPLRVALPLGRSLFLGPAKTGEISPKALEHPGVKKLIDAGSLEVVDGALTSHAMRGAAKEGHPSASGGHTPGGRVQRRGDRGG